MSFRDKKETKKERKEEKNQGKVLKYFRVTTVVRCLFSRISSLKDGINVRELKETGNLHLPQTVEGLAGSLNC